MENEYFKKRALLLCNEGQKCHHTGDVKAAIDLYTESIRLYPTAESHTFRGWAYSFQGRYDEAIEECKKAIHLDPGLGNPYNDIGSYLIAQGKADEAEEWLNKAKTAVKYDLRHTPFMNLGKLYAAKGQFARAIQEFEQALELFPAEPNCSAMLQYMKKILN